MSRIQALNKFCIVEPISETESTSSSGIVYATEAVPAKKAVKSGKLVAASEESSFGDGDLGSVVYYLEDSSFKVFIDGDEFVAVSSENLVGFIHSK